MSDMHKLRDALKAVRAAIHPDVTEHAKANWNDHDRVLLRAEYELTATELNDLIRRLPFTA